MEIQAYFIWYISFYVGISGVLSKSGRFLCSCKVDQ